MRSAPRCRSSRTTKCAPGPAPSALPPLLHAVWDLLEWTLPRCPNVGGVTFVAAALAVAAVLLIKAEPEHYEQLGAFYQTKRDRFRQQLLETRLVPLPVPGGYFQLVDYGAVSDLDDVAFCHWLTIEHGVAAIPLSPFYEAAPAGQRLARLCFAKNDATLDAAIERLQTLPEVADA